MCPVNECRLKNRSTSLQWWGFLRFLARESTSRKIRWGCEARFAKPSPKIDAVSLNIIYEALLMMVLSIMMKNYLLLRKHTQFKKSREKTIPIWDHNDQNRYPVYDQNSWNTIPFGAAHTYIAHIREYSLGGLWPQCGFSADHYILTVT